MQINSMNRINEKSISVLNYIIMAVIIGIIAYYLLAGLFDVAVLLFNVVMKYWWAAIIIVAIIIFFKMRGKNKNANSN